MEISIAAARMVRSFYLSKQGLRSKSNDCEKQWWILQREKLSNRLKDGCEARSDRTVQLFEGVRSFKGWLRSKDQLFVRPVVVRRMVCKTMCGKVGWEAMCGIRPVVRRMVARSKSSATIVRSSGRSKDGCEARCGKDGCEAWWGKFVGARIVRSSGRSFEGAIVRSSGRLKVAKQGAIAKQWWILQREGRMEGWLRSKGG